MKKKRTYLVLTNKAIELSNCQKEKMIEAYEKIISNIQEDDLAVTRCTLRKNPTAYGRNKIVINTTE